MTGAGAGGAAGAVALVPFLVLAGCFCLWCRGGLRLRFGLRLGCLRGRRGTLVADDRQLAADLDGLVLADADLEQGSGHRGRHFGVHLVGGDLDEGFVDGNVVADRLEPAGDGALGDRFAHGGQVDRGTGSGRSRISDRLLRRGFDLGGRRFRLGRLRRGGGLRFRLRLWFGLRFGFGGRRRLGGGAASVADHREFRTDLGGLVLGDDDFLQDAGERRRDLGVDLVGGDLDQGLVDGDLVADFLEPAGDSAFGDALTESRHLHGVRHEFSSLPWSTSG